METIEVNPCVICLRMNYIKKALPFLKVTYFFFHCLGDAGRGVSGGKTVSCDQVAFGKNVFVNIALRELELSSQTPCWLESKQEKFAFEIC